MTQQEIIVNARRSLLVFAQRQGITKACQEFGVSRTTFYKLKKQLLETGSLEPRIRRKPRMPNQISITKKKILLRMIQDHPNWGPDRYAYEFRGQGIFIASRTIWRWLTKFGLNKRYKRLIYLETLKLKGQPLTETSIKVLKKQLKKIQHGLWPGHVVALDTFYVGHLKGVGRVYQMTGIDLCSRYGWAQLYLEKTQKSATHFVENELIPKFFNNAVELETVLTDNGTEFTGHLFQGMLGDYDIRHRRIAPGKPMLNGYCERFQRTILEEFYQPIFRKQIFNELRELQNELNRYLAYYNFERAHFGLLKIGAKPIEVFKAKTSVLHHRFQKLLT
jgi:transposase InsO family protein